MQVRAKAIAMQPCRKDRHFGMDWLRIGAFQLLILYHVGMTFVPWDYHVKLASLDWVSVLMQLTSPWRLSLLFVVSGYASAALLARSGSAGAFFRQRLLRLTPAGEALEVGIFEDLRQNMARAYAASGGAAVAGYWTVLQHLMGDDARVQFAALAS